MRLTSTEDTYGSHTVKGLLTCKCLTVLKNPPPANHSVSIKIKECFDQTASHSTAVSPRT